MLSTRHALIIFIFILNYSIARATVAYIGSANYSQITESTSEVVIYGGISGDTAGCSSSEVCDTCTGTHVSYPTGRFPCNFRSVTPSLELQITLSATSVSGTFSAKFGSTALTVTTPTTLVAGQNFTVDISWSELCSKIGSSATCDNSFTGIISLGFDTNTDGTLDDKKDIKIHFANVPVTLASGFGLTQECPSTDPDDTKNYGFCYFSFQAGDGKVYVQDMAVGQNFPETLAANVPYKYLRVFFEAQQSGDNDATTLGTIKNTSESIAMNVSGLGLDDERITDLDNGTRYCFIAANEDHSGNIFYYADAANDSATTPYCATPNEVKGLLDDKSKCFIATAAFGSSMSSEVQSFRSFRDQFLMTNSLGRLLVKSYYQLSPPIANWIKNHYWARAAVRGILWPVLLVARASNEFGFNFFIFIFIFGICTVLTMRIFFKRKTV